MTGLQEYSLEQCAAAIQGYPSSYCTDTGRYIFVRSAMRAVKKLIGDDKDDAAASTDGSDSGSHSDAVEEDGDAVRLGDFIKTDAEAPYRGGGCVDVVHGQDGTVHYVEQHDNFGWRDPELLFLNYLEYNSMF